MKDKVGIVTGGAAGIGRASAIAFATEGARVVVADIDDRGAERTSAEIAALGGVAIAARVDVTVEDDVRALVETAVESFGGLDVIFNNAGGGSEVSASELPRETWERMVALNLGSVMLGCKYALPELVRRGGGAIVSTSSILGQYGFPGLPSYSAAKAGVLGRMRQIAVEYAPSGVRANCICPGWILTQTVEESIARSADPEREREEVVKSIPLGRFGRPEEVARLAVFLASEQSSFITGAAITIDGGFTSQ